MKETELWQRLRLHLGADYFRVWASEYSHAALGQRTVVEALSDGVPCKIIWRAVWTALDLVIHRIGGNRTIVSARP